MVSGDEQEGLMGLSRLPEVLAGVDNLSAFSRASGISRRMLDRYKAGVDPSLSVAARIARALRMPLDALVSDEYVSIPAEEGAAIPGDVVVIPMLDVVAAAAEGGALNGEPEEISGLPFSERLLRRLGVSVRAARFLRVRGDSMEPTIANRALVLVDQSQRHPADGLIYVFSIDGEVRIKRIQKMMDGTIVLISDNKALYAPEPVAPVDAERMIVEGRVFWADRSL